MKFEIAQSWALASLATSVLAAPQKRSAWSTLLGQLDYYAQWSTAAYCSGNTDGANKVVSCSAGNCPDVQAANTALLNAALLNEFDNTNSYGDASGFLAADNTNQHIVLSFRGSRTFSNWIADISTAPIPSSLCSGCQVHQGFWDDYQTVASTLNTQIDSAQKTYPGYALVVTGHSLGGALAMLCGTDLHNQGYTLTTYTYGQLRVGNLALAKYITNVDTQWRVTHTDDTVPKLPSMTAGFSHSSPEYWITSGNNVTVTTSDIQVITGIDSTAGNAGTTTSSTSAHNWYLLYIDGCT